MDLQLSIDLPAQLRRYRGGAVCTRDAAVAELIQNAQRAQASRLSFRVMGRRLVIEDDGCGCDDAAAYFTIARSGWGEHLAGEDPFGQGGLLSLVTVARRIEVQSRFGMAVWHIDNTLTNGVLDIEVVSELSRSRGFRVAVDLLDDVQLSDLQQAVKSEGRHVSDLVISWDGEDICRVDPTTLGAVAISGPGFSGSVDFGQSASDCPVLLCRGRPVRTLREFPFVRGGIEVNPRTLTLRLPDRKDVVADDKYKKFCDRLTNVLVDKITEVLLAEELTPEVINRIEGVVSHYVDPSVFCSRLDWMYYDDSRGTTTDQILSDDQISRMVSRAMTIPSVNSTCDTIAERVTTTLSSVAAPKPVTTSPERKKEGLIPCFWVYSYEIQTYKALLDEARYYDVPVVIVTDSLRRGVISTKSFPHIAEFRDKVRFETKIHYRLPKHNSQFRELTEKLFGKAVNIGYANSNGLRKKMICELPGRTYRRDLAVCAISYPEENIIVIHRDHMWPKPERGCFSGVTIHQFVFKNLNTIAHELAHLLFATTDGSKEHYRLESLISAALVNDLAERRKRPKTKS